MIELKQTSSGGAAQHGGLGGAIRAQREQATMRGILRVQHAIVDGKPLELIAAIGADRQPQVVAINALIDPHGTKFHLAGSIGASQMDMSQHVALQGCLTGAQLAPGNFSVAVAIQADRELAIANCQLQRAGDFRTLYLQAQETVAGNVSLRQRSRQQQRQYGYHVPPATHRKATVDAEADITRISCRPWTRAKSSAGLAAAG